MSEKNLTNTSIQQFRLCGSQSTADGWVDWEGYWLNGEGPTKNDMADAVQKVKRGQKNVRWEFRTVTYSPITTLEVTA